MKVSFGTVMRDVQLTTLAFAIAFGLALINTAQGVASLIEGLTEHGSGAHELQFQFGSSLNWVFGGHVFAFGPLVQGLIELGVVWVAAVLVRRRAQPDPPPAEAT